jgi:Mg-chelatase subunit ChlD
MSASAFIVAMDTHTPTQSGENGHVEYAWSHNPTEKIAQFYFQLVRCKDKTGLADLAKQLNTMLSHFKKVTSPDSTIPEHMNELVDLYRLIGHTRDVIDGKGERMLTYIQILVWNKHFPDLAKSAFTSLVTADDNTHQYGSWNDVKYFCQAVKDWPEYLDDSLITHAINLLAEQLKRDLVEFKSDKSEKKISLAVKHAPREGSKFDWVFRRLARTIYPYEVNFKRTRKEKQAFKASYTHLRQHYYSPLNKHIDTVEVKMADKDGKWSDIDYNRVPSKALGKYTKAWLNQSKKGEERSTKEDRRQAALNYKAHIEAAKKQRDLPDEEKTAKVHGKRCEIYDLVKRAWNVYGMEQSTRDQINLQWQDQGKSTGKLQNVIAMVDTSSSMTCDDSTPLFNAIGLGIRIAEKAAPAFKNRVLTFNSRPEWFNFGDCPDDDFVAKVSKVRDAPWGGSTDIYAAFKLILDVVKENNIPAADVANMTLIILSDMQINATEGNTDTLYTRIKALYMAAGFEAPPHIVFWNLRKTTGFPTKSDMPNVTMLSGFSSVLLNQFCEKGVDVLKNYNGYMMIHDILSAARYAKLEECIRMYFQSRELQSTANQSVKNASWFGSWW